eukprot:CAMPEP_0197683390 /NCGR_PEP_ID=MMETSP1338-20131121/97867_1 /TAXON_ID=43686 ORGANISM="Pelagodinium beii, Strain RCC1491" /NCGR_SAMPLE_ID=MMETSP1338 /ASSEMBLY_ACC=CAM_ASM_000754 /LENGTH=46 /DNA_ID= /DNA_START= /DNA_END= /DNA_ORIENTATION=
MACVMPDTEVNFDAFLRASSNRPFCEKTMPRRTPAMPKSLETPQMM